MSGPLHTVAVVAQAGDVGDPSATRTVYITIAALVLLGLLFVVLAFWLLRQTRPDLELLAPLEEMDRSSWRRADPANQRRLLDEARPAGADPLQPSAAEPVLDTTFAEVRPPIAFADLADGDPEAAAFTDSDLDRESDGELGDGDPNDELDDEPHGDTTGDIDVEPTAMFAAPDLSTAAAVPGPAPDIAPAEVEANGVDGETTELDRPAAKALEAAVREAAENPAERPPTGGDALDAV